MTEPRRFSRSQRAALYLAADGTCQQCGEELGPGWHADHATSYVAGGPTDVTNGQALCPNCNLKKGFYVTGLRQWQQDAIDKFYAHGDRDFLVCATPGAGKTTFGLELARRLLDEGTVRRVAVIVPTDALRQQWADEAGRVGIHLKPVIQETDYEKAGYMGYVATYAQLARGAGTDLARRSARVSTLALIDEIHHAGESKSWGDGLTHALEDATARVALTGTPWRQDQKTPIPFVTYDAPVGDDKPKVHVDAGYEYGEAVADGVCRSVEFHAYDGEARWRDCGQARSRELGVELPDDDVPAVLDAVFNPNYAWMPCLLKSANAALDDTRSEIPDAGGLVVASEQWHARAYAQILQQITGEEPTLAISDDPEAKSNIDTFRNARSKWIVAVKMVSEGVDIPRLAVGVYASRARTPLFFRQVVGRFVRARPDEEINARLFIPAIPTLMQHAHEIEGELRHQLDVVERERDERDTRERGDGQNELPLRESITATEAEFDRAIYKGDEISTDEMERAEKHCRDHNIPVIYASNIVHLLRAQDLAQPAQQTQQQPQQETQQKAEIPRHRRETMMRSEITRYANKVAHRLHGGANLSEATRDVNTRLLSAGFPQRKKASLEQLEQIRDYLTRWLDELS